MSKCVQFSPEINKVKLAMISLCKEPFHRIDLAILILFILKELILCMITRNAS
jgi:hypothetical protein